MNRSELISAVAESAGVKKDNAAKAVAAITEVIADALKDGEKVTIPGFGVLFDVSERAEHEGRNPRTGETVTIPASKSVKFKAGKNLKDAVNILEKF